MRVTKLIREYVEETVNGIYEPLIKNCDGDYYEKKKEVEEILEKLADEFDAAAKNFRKILKKRQKYILKIILKKGTKKNENLL